MADQQPQPSRRSYPINRHVLLLLASAVSFVLAAIAAEAGHAVVFAMWTWAFAGAAAFVASHLP